MNEEWKDILGYEGLYQISNLGRVMSLPKNKGWCKTPEKILNTRIKQGYNSVALYKNGKSSEYRVHRLVGQAFIPNVENKPFIHHIDGNKLNNNVNNLMWCTNQENQLYAYNEGASKPTYGFKGKKHSEESKSKISNSLLRHYRGGGATYVQKTI